MTLQSTRNCISYALCFFEHATVPDILASASSVMYPVFLNTLHFVHVFRFALSDDVSIPPALCERRSAHKRYVQNILKENVSFRRCKNRWDDNITMDQEILHFETENFFKLLCDINISCTNCLACSCQWQSAQVGSQRVYVLIPTLYFSDTVLLNVLLVPYTYTWIWLVPALLKGVTSAENVI